MVHPPAPNSDPRVDLINRQAAIVELALSFVRALEFGAAHPIPIEVAALDLQRGIHAFYGHSYGPMPCAWLDLGPYGL